MTFVPKGIIPAMVTPTDEWGNLKEQPLRRLTNHLIEGGVHGLFPVGSQGEFYALTPETKRRALEIVVEETGGRVPGTFPVVIKEALNLMGFDVGSAVRPVGPLPEQKREDLKRVLVEMGVL
jgi:4-hydroxy-tetrahydrodipicolinate synthase